MPQLPKRQALLRIVAQSRAAFESEARNTHDGNAVARAAATYNLVLKAAVFALVVDMARETAVDLVDSSAGDDAPAIH
jgi:hypothetical protein